MCITLNLTGLNDDGNSSEVLVIEHQCKQNISFQEQSRLNAKLKKKKRTKQTKGERIESKRHLCVFIAMMTMTTIHKMKEAKKSEID